MRIHPEQIIGKRRIDSMNSLLKACPVTLDEILSPEENIRLEEMFPPAAVTSDMPEMEARHAASPAEAPAPAPVEQTPTTSDKATRVWETSALVTTHSRGISLSYLVFICSDEHKC